MHQVLDERQQAVLGWVNQGCPDGVWPDSTYKVSAQALQNRGLINQAIARRCQYGRRTSSEHDV
ncbi:hypothetical protein [Streptomyces sp. NPDC058755]|uniref:hypothetical protein n=1 Tax=Streptomyces sp. NPDC058755 TaxID=3346624 RepID=UPI00369D3393